MSSVWSDTTNGNYSSNEQRDALLMRLSQRVEVLQTEILYLKYPNTKWRYLLKNISLEIFKHFMSGITDIFDHLNFTIYGDKDQWGYFSVEDVGVNLILMDLCRQTRETETGLLMSVKMNTKHHNDLFIVKERDAVNM